MVGIVYRLKYMWYFHIQVISCLHNYTFYYVHHFIFGLKTGPYGTLDYYC
jgi:hypothetical protein